MNWITSFLLSLPLVGLGLASSFYIADQCVRWFRISSAEGGSGYFIVAIMLLGGLLGLVIGLVMAGFFGPQNGGSHLKSFLIATGTLLTMAIIAYGSCRFIADLPPTMDGRELTLEVELRLPTGAASPTGGHGESFMSLASVVNHVQRRSQSGNLHPHLARSEESRWIVPGNVFVFTRRGRRSLAFQLNGQSLQGFIIPLPAGPGRDFLEWSDWGPRPPAPQPPWPDTQPSYRFRVQKIEPPPEPSQVQSDESEATAAEAAFAAMAPDAPIADYLEHALNVADDNLRERAIDAMTAKPGFISELIELIAAEDHARSAAALYLIDRLPDPYAELIPAVESAGRDIAERIRRFNTTTIEEDSSYQGAADISMRFSGWMAAVQALREWSGGDFTPELKTILELSRERPDSHVMRQDICRVASYYMSEWAGLEPLATDPKPR